MTLVVAPVEDLRHQPSISLAHHKRGWRGRRASFFKFIRAR